MKKIVISMILLVALMTAVTAVPSSMGLSKGQPFLYPQGSCPIGSSIRAINPDGTIICEIDDVGDTTADTIADDGVIQGNEVDSSQVQLRVSGTCSVGSSIREINSDGTVTCQSGLGITGTGSNGQVTFWTGTDTVSGNNLFFWDNADSQLGIGTNSPINGLRTHQIGSTFIDASNNAHGIANTNVALTVDGAGGHDIAKFRDTGANQVFDINSNSIELYAFSGVSVIMFAAKTPGGAGGDCGTSCQAVSANAACLAAWTSTGAPTSCGTGGLPNARCLCSNFGS
jgi:hypothetical protein